jgi:GNAT superfamily N-acetyltransferase
VDAVRVVEAGADRIPEIEPLWRALYEHHREIATGVAGVRPFEDTWRRRRRQYEGWLAGDDAMILLAERDGRAVGYAALTVGPGPATWDLGERVVELETLSVLADERGSGVGAALLDASRRWARERGARTIGVGLAHTNEGARRFYERAGFTPFYVELVLDLDRVGRSSRNR